ncbi:MAG: hypothetical protein ACLFN0_06290 [Thermovirgaceae bacterium]
MKMRRITTLAVSCLLVFMLAPALFAQESIEIQKILFAQEVTTFGLYEEEPSSTFKEDSQTVVYLELDNFRRVESNGTYSVDVALDFALLDSSGKALINEKNMVNFGNDNFKSKINDLYFTVDLNLKGIPAGEYTVVATVKDNNAKNYDEEQLGLEIVE